MLRYLRITAAVGFALLALATTALWVRSQRRHDIVVFPLANTCSIGVGSMCGIAACEVLWLNEPVDLQKRLVVRSDLLDRTTGHKRWHFQVYSFGGSMAVPHWFAIVLLLGAAILAMPRRRFSVRVALIVTMLVAVTLGLAVYSTRGDPLPPAAPPQSGPSDDPFG